MQSHTWRSSLTSNCESWRIACAPSRADRSSLEHPRDLSSLYESKTISIFISAVCRRYAKLLTHHLSANRRMVIRLVCVSPRVIVLRFMTINPRTHLTDGIAFALHLSPEIDYQEAAGNDYFLGRYIYQIVYMCTKIDLRASIIRLHRRIPCRGRTCSRDWNNTRIRTSHGKYPMVQDCARRTLIFLSYKLTDEFR